jgi:ethanolamine permease
MCDSPAEISAAPATLKAGSLHWLQVAALGIAIAISGNVSGWNYGLGVGGWGGMLLAALAMAVLFLCLTQTLAELAAALPEVGGFDGYVRRALGPTAAYLAGMSVGIALAVGAGLAVSFSEAYMSAWLGVGGWPVKLAFLVCVMGLQLRGASEAVGLTVAVGVTALLILVAFCLFMAPEFQSVHLFSAAPDGAKSLFPRGLPGTARSAVHRLQSWRCFCRFPSWCPAISSRRVHCRSPLRRSFC